MTEEVSYPRLVEATSIPNGPLGVEYEGADNIGRWVMVITDTGKRAYGLFVGRIHAGIGVGNVGRSIAALQLLDSYLYAHPEEAERRWVTLEHEYRARAAIREWQAHLASLPFWRRWLVKLLWSI